LIDFTQWLDPVSALLVLGGTLLAALLRCGWGDTRETLKAVAQLAHRPFASDQVRAELALQIQEIGEDGLVRARPHHFGDREFDAVADALIHSRSLTALHEEHDRHRAARLARANTAVAVLGQAADLAPVLGLAGTLLSLGGLTALASGGDTAGAIGMAVTTTLYGLVLANFVFAPLAAAVGRRSRACWTGWRKPCAMPARPCRPPRPSPGAAPHDRQARERLADDPRRPVADLVHGLGLGRSRLRPGGARACPGCDPSGGAGRDLPLGRGRTFARPVACRAGARSASAADDCRALCGRAG
jgi:chemotaxis protein MotA